MNPREEAFDYIVVGAGTAGCVVASRLSASGKDKVLLIEAGGSDRRFWIRVPVGYGNNGGLYGRQPNWKCAGVMLNEDCDKPLETPENRTMDHHRLVFSVVCADVTQLKPCR